MCADGEAENAWQGASEGEALGGSVLLHRVVVLPTLPV